MTITDKPEFHKALEALHALYPIAAVLDVDQIDHYWLALRDLDLDVFTRGVRAAAQQSGTGKCRYFPPPGVIRELGRQSLYQAREALQRSAAACPECRGTGFRMVEGTGLFGPAQPTVTRCRHASLRKPAL